MLLYTLLGLAVLIVASTADEKPMNPLCMDQLMDFCQENISLCHRNAYRQVWKRCAKICELCLTARETNL
ncbi:hypothetical protein Q1695_005789 [Nippostrongylus brasiliensis]|nr:hypothetical protein Q1695_005789 [Nippostrongylus brasiliensis]